MSVADFVQVRIPAALRDEIDVARGSEKREPWVRRALEAQLRQLRGVQDLHQPKDQT